MRSLCCLYIRLYLPMSVYPTDFVGILGLSDHLTLCVFHQIFVRRLQKSPYYLRVPYFLVFYAVCRMKGN
jgi:hypothetical protein